MRQGAQAGTTFIAAKLASMKRFLTKQSMRWWSMPKLRPRLVTGERGAIAHGRRHNLVAIITITLLVALIGLVTPAVLPADAASVVPSITDLDPSSGFFMGGTEVTITGEGLADVTEVMFGSVSAPYLLRTSPTEVTAVAPPQEVGTVVPISVVASGTTSQPSEERFTYFDGRWSPTETLETGRVTEAGTVLDGPACRAEVPPAYCGDVLVVGGMRTSSGVPLKNAEIYDRAEGSWTQVADEMATGRYGHRVTLLDGPGCNVPKPPDYCGNVLISGGIGAQGTVASAELYDPAARSFDSTGAMTLGRAGHTATVLVDGLVLVTGGSVQPTAEVYDPSATTCGTTGCWLPVPDEMAAERHGHAATRLPSGAVLISGGDPDGSAELFDPGQWSFEEISPMSQPRLEHTMTPLPSGAILVVGGRRYGEGVALSTTEIYDPASGAWTSAAALTGCSPSSSCGSRTGHAAVPLSSGEVLIVGGTSQAGNSKYRHASAQIYHPGRDSWRATGSMATPRENPSAFELVGGFVVVVGGTSTDPATGEIFDPAPRDRTPAVVALDPDRGPTTGLPVTIEGTDLFPVQRVTFDDAPVRIVFNSNRRIIATAPKHAQGPADVTVEVGGHTAAATFTYTGGAWSDLAPMTDCGGPEQDPSCTARVEHTATVLDGPDCRRQDREPYCGSVLVVGGTGTRFLTCCGAKTGFMQQEVSGQLYDPASGTWQPTADPLYPRFGHTATLLDGPKCHTTSSREYCGDVLIAGGRQGREAHVSVPFAEIYDPDSDTWREAGALHDPRFRHTATLMQGPACSGSRPLLSCGRVMLVGGSNDYGNRHALPSTEFYDPKLNAWLPGPRLDSCIPASESCTPRTYHTTTLLDDGQLLVAGGLGRTFGPGIQGDVALPQTCDVNGAVGREVFDVKCKHLAINTVQLFDPAANDGVGRWNPARSMAIDRFGAAAIALADGRVLVSGGFDGSEPLASVELYDPDARPDGGGPRGLWDAGTSLREARVGHTTTHLHDGSVMVAGGGVAFLGDEYRTGPISDSAEMYDPVEDEWKTTAFLRQPRGIHTATALGGPACAGTEPPSYCGAVMVAGGITGSDNVDYRDIEAAVALSSTEMYIQAPTVAAVTPRTSARSGTDGLVRIEGSGFDTNSSVLFGSTELPPTSFTVDSTAVITALVPARPPGTVEISVENEGGTSLAVEGNPRARFTYLGNRPGVVTDIVARPISGTAIHLAFKAASINGDDQLAPAAVDYVIRQSRSPITTENFPQATSLCGGVCHFEPSDAGEPLEVGSPLTQEVQGLSPGTTYYYAIQATSGDSYGDVSDDVEVRTPGDPPADGTEVEEATGVPSAVNDLAASSRSARGIELAFTAPDDGSGKAASHYLIKQSDEPITESNFSEASTLCGGVCSFEIAAPGDRITLSIKELEAATTYHYALKPVGSDNREGELSNQASATTEPDTIAPDAVGDLAAAPLSGSEIALTFSAPASDAGEGPPVTDYVIKQAREPITEASFESAKTLCDGTCEFTPAAAGEQLTLSVTGLESSSTYHYALKAVDEGQNVSGLSNMAFATTSEVTPGKVTGLEATPKSMSKIALAFAAADDGTGEAATSYVIKQSKRAMRSEDDFSKAQTLCGESCRFEATEIGQRLRLAVTGLDPDTTYHYAIRALDDSGDNLGARSMSVKARTRPDRIAPGKVDDLRAKALSKTAVKLLFSAVASNGSKGLAVTTYIIKQSSRPITSAGDFKRAQTLCGKICSFDVAKVGGRLSLKITELSPATTYYYAVVAKDAGGNRGPGSNLTKVRTSGR